MMHSLRELGEDRLLAQILPQLKPNSRVIAGAGDDCAVVKFRGAKEWLLLKTDCIVEGIHFVAGNSGRAMGWKAMMRGLSDFAAMSGVPQFALITLVIAGKKQVTWVRDLYRGLNQGARYFDVAIVGGETSDTAGPTVVVVSVAGFVEPDRCVLRSGGKANDDLFVTGKLGGSIRGRHLNFVARIKEARWLTANFKVHAMMDLYRGLNQAGRYFDVAIVGGETSDTAGPTVVVVSVAGFVEPDRCILRSGAGANDDLFVTGKLGGSIRGRHLNFVARIEEARWLTANFKVHAMMDLSDGLGTDLPRLAKASKVGFSIDQSALPISRGCTIEQAISDGEDYELLFAISPRDRDRLERTWKKKFPKLPLTRIGSLSSRSAIRKPQLPIGYVHFRQHR